MQATSTICTFVRTSWAYHFLERTWSLAEARCGLIVVSIVRLSLWRVTLKPLWRLREIKHGFHRLGSRGVDLIIPSFLSNSQPARYAVKRVAKISLEYPTWVIQLMAISQDMGYCSID